MSLATGKFSLKCSNCNKQHDFSPEDADFDPSFGSERQMGPEHGYVWEHNFSCDKCGNKIEIDYQVWEYPEGTFNNDQLKITGGTEVERFDYDFNNEPEPDDK